MSDCHECYCHLAPPCGQCVDCKHVDISDCDNDCQDCEDHPDEVPAPAHPTRTGTL